MYRVSDQNSLLPLNKQGPSCRRLFANFPDYFQKSLYIRDFFGNSLESWRTITFSFFPSSPQREFGNFSCIVYTHTKLHVQAKKSLFLIFHLGHDGPFSLPCSVNSVIEVPNFHQGNNEILDLFARWCSSVATQYVCVWQFWKTNQ